MSRAPLRVQGTNCGWIPGTAPSARAWLAAAVLAAALTGCSFTRIGRSAAGGAVQGLGDRRDTLAVVTGQVMDTVTSRVIRILRDSLRPELKRLVAEATDTAGVVLQRRTGQVEDQLAAYLAGTLRDSVGRLVGGLTRMARDSMERALEVWIRASAADARREFTPVVSALTDSALAHALATLDASLKGPLRATILDLVGAAADSVRKKAEQASKTVTTGVFDRLRALGWQILVPLGLVLLAAAGFTYWQFKKRQRILEVIATEIRNEGSEGLKDRIKARAQEQHVEGDLNEFLKKRNLV